MSDLRSIVHPGGLDYSPTSGMVACVLASEAGGDELVVFPPVPCAQVTRLGAALPYRLARPRWHRHRPVLSVVADARDILVCEPGRPMRSLALGAHEVTACEWLGDSSWLLIGARRAGEGRVSVLRVSASGGPPEVIVADGGDCVDFAVDASGERVAVVIRDSARPRDVARTRLVVVNLITGARVTIPALSASVSAVAWAPDGRYLAAIARRDGGARWSNGGRLLIVDLEHGSTTTLASAYDAGHPLGPARALAWRGEQVLFAAPHRGAVRVFAADTRSVAPISGPDGHVLDFAPTTEGRIVYVDAWPDRLPAIHCVESAGGGRYPVHEPNAALDARIYRPKVVRLESTTPDGLRTETVVTLPAGTTDPPPPLLLLHGGPHASSPSPAGGDAVLPLLAARDGWATVMPNPRGSTGYGSAFQAAVVGAWGSDAADVLAALEAARAARICARTPSTAIGWSYGGFLAAWLLVTTGELAAAVIGAPVTDLVSFSRTTDAPEFAQHELGRQPEAMRRRSPLWRVARPVSPALLLHAEDDRRCPLDQSSRFIAAIRARGSIGEFVTYPGSDHVLQRSEHVEDALARTIGWALRYGRGPRTDGRLP